MLRTCSYRFSPIFSSRKLSWILEAHIFVCSTSTYILAFILFALFCCTKRIPVDHNLLCPCLSLPYFNYCHILQSILCHNHYCWHPFANFKFIHYRPCYLPHSFIYFTFHWSYTDVELVIYTFSTINKASVHKLCLIIAS
jgi:hypothetical protein